MNINIKTVQTGTGKHKHLSRVFYMLALVGVIGSLGVVNSAHADNLYKTSFEQPTFLPGGQLLGLDGWSTAIQPFLNPGAAFITIDSAF